MPWIFMSILCYIRPYLENNSECFKQAQENKELKKPLKLTCCAPGDPITNAPLCVCACVYVCFFILFHLLVSSGCTMSVTYMRCLDQQSFVVSIIRGFCQVPSSLFLNLSYLTSKTKTKTPADSYWRENK